MEFLFIPYQGLQLYFKKYSIFDAFQRIFPTFQKRYSLWTAT